MLYARGKQQTKCSAGQCDGPCGLTEPQPGTALGLLGTDRNVGRCVSLVLVLRLILHGKDFVRDVRRGTSTADLGFYCPPIDKQ